MSIFNSTKVDSQVKSGRRGDVRIIQQVKNKKFNATLNNFNSREWPKDRRLLELY